MVDFRKLLQNLEKELRIQEDLLKILAKETTAIIGLKNEEIEKIVAEKEKVFEKAFALKKDREAILLKATGEEAAGEQKKPLKLDMLLTACADRALSRSIEKVQMELKTTCQSVQELHYKNNDLIRQSLGVISSTIAIMCAQPGTELPTYTTSGKLTSESEDPAFMKRSGSVVKEA